MKPPFLTFLLFAGIALAPAASLSGEKNRPPRIEVEIVWAEIQNNKTDLFLLITNPNAFDVHVAKCVYPTMSKTHDDFTESPIQAEACSVTGLNDFFLVGARAHRLLTLWHCPLAQGLNEFKIHVSSWVDPKLHLPTNYVEIGNRDFSFSITNPDTLSR